MRLAFLATVLAFLSACSRSSGSQDTPATRGKHFAAWYGCGSCHEIPGLPSATGKVGPPLRGIGQRSYLAGHLPNTPENLIRWIRTPRDVHEHTIMPNMDIPAREARDIAAYLYTLH